MLTKDIMPDNVGDFKLFTKGISDNSSYDNLVFLPHPPFDHKDSQANLATKSPTPRQTIGKRCQMGLCIFALRVIGVSMKVYYRHTVRSCNDKLSCLVVAGPARALEV